MGKRKTQFAESLALNTMTYDLYLELLTQIAVSQFEWRNLPSTVDPRFLELTLFNDGQAVFFADDVMGYLGLQCLIKGALNVYRIPVDRQAYAVNGYRKNLTDADSVIIYNNYMHTNSVNLAKLYARKLYDIDRAIDINVRGQKTPVGLQCDEKQRLSVINAYKDYDGNQPVLFLDKSFDLNSLKTIRTDVPFVSDKLYEIKTKIWNEALTYLGVVNVTEQKKERMIVDEVQRSLGGTIASRFTRLGMRQEACKQINEMFGLNISVTYRYDNESEVNKDE